MRGVTSGTMLPWLTSPPAQPRNEGTCSEIHNALPEARATITHRSNAVFI